MLLGEEEWMSENLLALMQQQMVEIIGAHAAQAREHVGKGAIAPRILEVMASVPRHEFVPAELVAYAYLDQPLPIGHSKTISQPFIIALMTDLLDVREDSTVLEVGTGLGYHAAILSSLAAHIYSVEIVEELAAAARRKLAALGYSRIFLKVGNGELGWPEHAPFDRILVCAASELVPAVLLHQLKPGGRMVVPTGVADAQVLTLVEKSAGGKISMKEIMPVRFALLETES
ncbi:MAG: protein-L-isoaspartate(D-aspartate) O-methyltransferase [Rhodospirillales bacterium]|nr:protein-L-isoaspartate(D-aspartate) O-methyltransferase [Rhodospirillales bacterium]